MRTQSSLRIGFIVLLLLFAASARGEAKADDEALPPGAVARLSNPSQRVKWPFSRLSFAVNGRTLTGISRQPQLVRWNTADWKEIVRIQPGQPPDPKEVVRDVSPDGRLLLTQPCETLFLLCDSTTLRPIRAIRSKGRPSYAADFSQDGRLILLVESPDGRKDFHVRLLCVKTGEQKANLPLRSYPWNTFLSADGATLAYCNGNEETIHAIDTASGVELSRFDLHGSGDFGEILPVFSPNGAYLAAAIYRRKGSFPSHEEIRIWQTKTGVKMGGFKVPWNSDDYRSSDRIRALAISPDGRQLATAREGEAIIRLWETASSQECRRLQGHRDVILVLAISPDGKTLVSGSRDFTCLVWDVRAPKDRAKAELSPQDLASLWKDLAADARRADEAIRKLAAAPKQSVPFLQARLHPVAALEPKRIDHLLADLDSEQFEAREKATQELQQLGERVETRLKQVLKQRPALEVRRRLEQLLKRIDEHVLDAETLRQLRALACLEYAGTTEARAIVESLSRGADDARLTHEAKAALQRLRRQR